MPNRGMHNAIARRITHYSAGMINDVNAKVDSTVKEKGFHHREDYHSLRSLRKDSIEVHHFNPKREVIRRIHIAMDFNPKVRRLAKLGEVLKEVKKHRNYRYHK